MRGSGANWSNISAGFAGVSNALSQGLSIKAQQQLEAMRDARAENLARFQYQWKAQHDINMLDREHEKQVDMLGRQSVLQDKSQAYGESMQTQRELAAQKLNASNQQFSMDHWVQISADSEKRQQERVDADKAVTNQKEIGKARADWAKSTQESDRQEAEIHNNISRAMASRNFEAPQDPVEREKWMRADPEIGPMKIQLDSAAATRQQIHDNFALYLHDLGDPQFASANIQTPGGAPPGAPKTAAPPFDTSGGGTSTPNNPYDHQVPAERTSPADNIPAVPAASQLGVNQPTAMPPPTRSMVGPLNQPPRLIQPNMAAPGAFSNIGNPMGGAQTGAPSLVPGSSPQQGY